MTESSSRGGAANLASGRIRSLLASAMPGAYRLSLFAQPSHVEAEPQPEPVAPRVPRERLEISLETFHGRDLLRVSEAVRASLGEDAIVIQTRLSRESGMRRVEVVAAPAEDVRRLQAHLECPPLPEGRPAGKRRPLVIALVGLTGAGKTTTIAKLAVNEGAFGGRRVGLISLDTYRVGAVEQLESFAAIADLPLEVVHAESDVEAAMRRLSACDVILIDTPGRSPADTAANEHWMKLLGQMRPDEVHLVVPAPVRPDMAEYLWDAFQPAAVSHLLLSKLDEVPGDRGIADLAIGLGLPTRWLTDGQAVPVDLHPAPARILSSLGGLVAPPVRERVPA